MSRIHPTAIVHPEAKLHDSVEIGPYSVIGARVTIGAECIIGPHVVIDGRTTLGVRNHVFQFASVGTTPQDLKYHGEDTQLVIGDGNQIREFTTLSIGTQGGGGITRVGNGNLFMAYSHVAHDCALGDGVILANGALLAGHVSVADHTFLGGGAAVHQHCRLGESVMVAGHASITRDVPHFVMVADRDDVIGFNVVGLKRRGFSRAAIAELKAAYHAVYFTPGNIREVAAQQVKANAFETAEATRAWFAGEGRALKAGPSPEEVARLLVP